MTDPTPPTATEPSQEPPQTGPPPPAIICVGMAGSGKTTFMQRLNAHLYAKKQPPYIINLDPAVRTVPFARNIDIRDSVNYKEVMKQYNLGPNGGIMTCLNLFATKVDQVVGILEKRSSTITSILVDTPGQIECFVWSASGAIIMDALASGFPTVIAYIIDTPRTTAPATFMSNMLYACSILYKTKLPMILVFNKTDAQDAGFAKEWMTDFEAFQLALQKEEGNDEGVGGSGYMSSLLNSMSLMLDEFYKHLDLVAVSAMTGAGIDDFMKAVEGKCEEYERDYRPEMEKAKKKRADDRAAETEREFGKLMRDMDVDDRGNGKEKESAGGGGGGREEPGVISDIESSDEEAGQGLLERDEDEEMGQDDEGLQAKFERLGKGPGTEGDSGLDESLKRYLGANSME